MQVIESISKLQEILQKERTADRSIGLVPTMGYLHDGHLSLIEQAVRENQVVVVSIFVNPTQFGPDEDFEEYPRDLERDSTLAEEAGVDYIFSPEVEEMYFADHSTFVQVNELTDKLCGRFRSGHFRGVTTVVSKLFNIVQPHRAYFGQKDWQQFVVIKRMVRDLNFPVKLEMVPIVREEDGLALSSRNKYLSPEAREIAPVLYQALKKGRQMVREGQKEATKIKARLEKMIAEKKFTEIEYIAIVNPENLKEVSNISGKTVIALAVYVEDTRLIDNIIIREGDIPDDENSTEC
ncbi:MAG: pantoate--beta-alanine ligase [Halanaerobiaceae bacterium]